MNTTAIVRSCTKALVVLMVLAMIISLAACGTLSIEESIGVGADDNAILRVEAHVDPAWSESSADYCRTEFPKNVDVTMLSPEQLEAATDC